MLTNSGQTLFALALFISAMALESAVWLRFLRRLRLQYPKQWAHASQPPLWRDRTLFSARDTMLYLKNYAFLSSQDSGGIRYCERNRATMLVVYWITAIAGAALLVSVAVHGW